MVTLTAREHYQRERDKRKDQMTEEQKHFAEAKLLWTVFVAEEKRKNKGGRPLKV